MDLLSRRRLSRGELRDKLLFRKYIQGEIEVLLDHYEELGYLDDNSLAADYSQQRLTVKPMGRRLLRMELLKRRIPAQIVDDAVETAFEKESEEQVAEKAIESALRKSRLKSKVWNALSRLGFPYDVIERVISSHTEQIEDDRAFR